MKHHRPNQQSKVWPWFWQKKIPPIRGRIRGATDAEDIWPEVTYQLIRVEQPVENVAAWLFRAARNEMTDLGDKKRELPCPAGCVDCAGQGMNPAFTSGIFTWWGLAFSQV